MGQWERKFGPKSLQQYSWIFVMILKNAYGYVWLLRC